MTYPTRSTQLVRPTHGRMIGGVAAAIAARFGWTPGAVRLAMLASCLLPGPQVIAYVIAWAVIPDQRTSGAVLVS